MLHSIKVIELIMFFIEEHLRKTSLGMHYFKSRFCGCAWELHDLRSNIPIDGVVLYQPQRDLKPFRELIAQQRTCFIYNLTKPSVHGDFFIFFERAQGLLCGYSFSPSTCLLMKLLWLHQWFYVISQTHLIENWKLWMELKVLDRY